MASVARPPPVAGAGGAGGGAAGFTGVGVVVGGGALREAHAMASVTTATTRNGRMLSLGFRASENRHDLAAFTPYLQEFPSPLAHVRPPADEFFPLLGGGTEDTQIGDVLPMWRIQGVGLWLAGHRGRSGGTVSRVLFTRWYEQMVISLGQLSPAVSCGLPAARTTRAGSRCLFGLAPTGGCRATPVTRRAVGSYPTFSPLPFGYKGGLFSVALFRRLTAPRRYLAVCPVELGLSSMGPKRPTATIGPTTSRAPNYRPAGASGKPSARHTPDHAGHAVRHRPIEPETIVGTEHERSQSIPLVGPERVAIGFETDRRERVEVTVPVHRQ
jgi:hypothetical protein